MMQYCVNEESTTERRKYSRQIEEDFCYIKKPRKTFSGKIDTSRCSAVLQSPLHKARTIFKVSIEEGKYI